MHEVPNPRLRGSTSRASAEGSICVCFDMDGLLVNTEPMWWHSEAELMREYGGQWTDEDGRACVGGPLEKVADVIISRTGRGEVANIIADLIQRMVALLSSERIELMPGAQELMMELATRGARMALVSASPRVLVDAVLHSLGELGELFEFSISCDDVRVSKPDPEPYLLAAHTFAIETEAMIVLEDSPTGVAAALGAGARVIAVPHLVNIVPTPRMAVVQSLADERVPDLIGLKK